jgi:anaerobic ribonucleoside-triphosphate reductase activating protein
MLKYVDAKVVFQEVPDEISLAISISGCPCKCKGCHSSYLADDIGITLGSTNLIHLINSNKGITCVCFMGGDGDPFTINELAKLVKEVFPKLKVAWYSGKDDVYTGINLKYFDYIKIGSYKQELGALDSKTTNQRMYKIIDSKPEDITYIFWEMKTPSIQ